MSPDVIFPPWLPVLRAAGYRIEAVPDIHRERVQQALRVRGIRLRRPGEVWASNGKELTP
jgi:hypothetical protein